MLPTRLAVPWMLLIWMLLILYGFLALPGPVAAQVCGGCFFGPPPTLSDLMTDTDVVVLGKWLATRPKSAIADGSTEFEIVQILYQPAFNGLWELVDEETMEPVRRVHLHDRRTVSYSLDSKPGDLYLLTARFKDDNLVWHASQQRHSQHLTTAGNS